MLVQGIRSHTLFLQPWGLNDLEQGLWSICHLGILIGSGMYGSHFMVHLVLKEDQSGSMAVCGKCVRHAKQTTVDASRRSTQMSRYEQE